MGTAIEDNPHFHDQPEMQSTDFDYTPSQMGPGNLRLANESSGKHNDMSYNVYS